MEGRAGQRQSTITALSGIARSSSRTFVLATDKTKAAILDAMKNRRTYASLDRNLQCRYTVNGAPMGSTLSRPDVLRFDIAVSDPDSDNAKDKITKIDIVKDGGVVVQQYTPEPAHSVRWTPEIRDSSSSLLLYPGVERGRRRCRWSRPCQSGGVAGSGMDGKVGSSAAHGRPRSCTFPRHSTAAFGVSSGPASSIRSREPALRPSPGTRRNPPESAAVSDGL